MQRNPTVYFVTVFSCPRSFTLVNLTTLMNVYFLHIRVYFCRTCHSHYFFSLSATRLLGVIMSVQLVFIATHWEKYNTGVLFLSWGYDVSQYVSIILYYLLIIIRI